MASALDLIAAIGATFGGRPEALRALPAPPPQAFLLCIFAMLWAALWRGHLRWLALAPFAACLAVYVAAPRPDVAFDADLRAVFIRTEAVGEDPWRLIAGRGRSTYARDRIGALLGLAAPRVSRLAAPEACTESACQADGVGARALLLVRTEAGFAAACIGGAIVLTPLVAPEGFAERCAPAFVIDGHMLAQEGGGFIYLDGHAPRIARAWPQTVQRPWTRRAAPESADQT